MICNAYNKLAGKLKEPHQSSAIFVYCNIIIMSFAHARRSIEALDKSHLAVYLVTAVGSVWLLSKLFRALAHYAFPRQAPTF